MGPLGVGEDFVREFHGGVELCAEGLADLQRWWRSGSGFVFRLALRLGSWLKRGRLRGARLCGSLEGLGCGLRWVSRVRCGREFWFAGWRGWSGFGGRLRG